MKKLLFLLVLGFVASYASAETKTMLKINVLNGEEQAFDISEIQNITFEDGVMKVKNANGAVTDFNIDNIDDMVFTTVVGIEGVFDYALENNLNIKIENGLLTATQPDTQLTLRVFTVAGANVDMRQGQSVITYQFSDLREGEVYIILVNDKAIKFIR